MGSQSSFQDSDCTFLRLTAPSPLYPTFTVRTRFSLISIIGLARPQGTQNKKKIISKISPKIENQWLSQIFQGMSLICMLDISMWSIFYTIQRHGRCSDVVDIYLREMFEDPQGMLLFGTLDVSAWISKARSMF